MFQKMAREFAPREPYPLRRNTISQGNTLTIYIRKWLPWGYYPR